MIRRQLQDQFLELSAVMKNTAPDVDLDQLIEIFVETDERQIRIMEDSRCIGVVTRMGLLRGIQGKEDLSL